MAFDWGTLTGQVLTTGGGIFAADAATKAAKDAAATQAQNNATALQLAQINQDTERLKLSGATASPAKSNTTLYIALGVGGVLILGLTIFAVTRK
jgi:hypothetical protein